MVNSPQDTWKVDNMKPFIEAVLKREKKKNQPSYTTEKLQSVNPEENTTPTTPRDKTFAQVKTQLANLEAEFVFHKETTTQTISELSQSIEMKNKEIEVLKNKEKEKQQIISDLTLKLLQMEESVSTLNKRCKKIEEKNSCIQQSLHKCHSETPTWDSISPPPPHNTTAEYNVPTSNSFEPLHDDAPCSTTETNAKENTIKGNDGDEQNVTTEQDSPCSYAINNMAQMKDSKQPEMNNSNYKPINAETIIICDSNGRYLKPEELCPDSTTKYFRCPTLSKARQIIETSNFTNAKNFIIHCGTNDIEHPEENTVTNTIEVVDLIKEKNPNCRILLSSLLPRKEELNKQVLDINEKLKTLYPPKPLISTIPA